MKVEYHGGAWNPGDFLKQPLPEVCFMGRSNVGKSSLINTLCKQRQLARVSNTPGRTQALHFFSVSNRFCLVDLPGFGYAKAPAKVRRAWKPLVESYLNDRPALKLALLLVDIRRDPRDEERALLATLKSLSIPTLLVVTKTDKVAKTRRGGRLQQLASGYSVGQGNVLEFSALSRDGRQQIWDRIESAL